MASGFYSEEFNILNENCDERGKLKYSSLFSFMQQTASNQCDLLGFGRDRLVAEYGVCYVIVRMTVNFDRIPSLGEKISVTTWPDSKLRPVFQRYFTYKDENGDEIGSAVSSWVLMNLQTRKIVNPVSVGLVMPDTSSAPVPFTVGKFVTPVQSESAFISNRAPKESDCDNNGHVNNAKYLDWVFDALPQGKAEVSSLDIVYKNEISADSSEPAEISTDVTEDGFCVIIKSSGAINIECKGDFVK